MGLLIFTFAFLGSSDFGQSRHALLWLKRFRHYLNERRADSSSAKLIASISYIIMSDGPPAVQKYPDPRSQYSEVLKVQFRCMLSKYPLAVVKDCSEHHTMDFHAGNIGYNHGWPYNQFDE